MKPADGSRQIVVSDRQPAAKKAPIPSSYRKTHPLLALSDPQILSAECSFSRVPIPATRSRPGLGIYFHLKEKVA
jgi:hypothetical protein